jgi:hypothetical protein
MQHGYKKRYNKNNIEYYVHEIPINWVSLLSNGDNKENDPTKNANKKEGRTVLLCMFLRYIDLLICHKLLFASIKIKFAKFYRTRYNYMAFLKSPIGAYFCKRQEFYETRYYSEYCHYCPR